MVCYLLAAFRFSGLSTGIKDKISLSDRALCTLALRCFLRGVWRAVVRRGAAVGVRRDGEGRVDWIWATEVLATASQSRRFLRCLRVRARSVILRRDTMKSSLLGLLLLATSSRAILPVSVTLVEDQG